MKRCSGCGELKGLDEFHRDRSARDGRDHRCKACKSAWEREHYARNREQEIATEKQYYLKNRDAILAKKSAYRAKRKEERKEYHREYYVRNRDKIRANTLRNQSERSEWFQALKATLSCSRCGESHPACIEFHHLDPSQKDDLVGAMARQGLSKERILEEVKKCEPLCSNCHRKEHWRGPK